MRIDQFEKLAETGDGRKIVALMSDPSMLDEFGNPRGFLSLVDKGANGQRIKVSKIDQPAEIATSGFAGQEDDPAKQAMTRRIFDAILGALGMGPSTVAKGDEPAVAIVFDAAIAVPDYWDGFWSSHSVLCDTLRNVMLAENMTAAEKVAQAKENLAAFSARVLDLFKPVVAAKGAAEIARLGEELATVAKRDSVINGRDLGTLRAAARILSEIADPSTATTAKRQETAMDLKAIFEQAGEAAISLAKKHGVTDPAKLAEIGTAAVRDTAAKAAMMNPIPQPSLTPDALANQLAEAGFSGSPGNMEQKVLSALNGIGGLVKKSVADALAETGIVAKVDKLAIDVNGGEVDGKKIPGLRDVVGKTTELVAKIAGTPAAPNGSGDPPPKGEERTTTKKADEDTWKGSTFDFGGLKTE